MGRVTAAAGERVTGVVRVWHHDEGWGVVDAPETPGGCRVDLDALDAPGYGELRAGQQVLLEFEPAEPDEQDGFAYRATRVDVLQEGHPGG
jgi:CspA family cold shock protein